MFYGNLNYRAKRNLIINGLVQAMAMDLVAEGLKEKYNRELTQEEALEIIEKVLFREAMQIVDTFDKQWINSQIRRINIDLLRGRLFSNFASELNIQEKENVV